METGVEPVQAPPAVDETIGSFLRRNALGAAIAAGAFCLLFGRTMADLGRFWAKDGDYSHGFLIPPACALILYLHRERLAGLPARRSLAGLAVLLLGLASFFVGRFTITDFFTRSGLYVSLIGCIWFLLGGRLLRACPFPFFFLAFAFPPPAFLFGRLRKELRDFATQASTDLLSGMGYEAVQNGNTLMVGENAYGVEDACSGIRSMMVIIAAAAFYAYLFRAGPVRGAILILTAIPVTVAVNILRILIVVVSKESHGLDLTRGTVHDALSVAVFGISLVFLYVSLRFYDWLVPRKAKEPPS